ncbi:Thiolase, N-terminal domain-containing protein [Xylogone sp. PMI_703]|nr:Thiolase, N-terminal domain-containing protein [Xylogone sp. PMI_703]
MGNVLQGGVGQGPARQAAIFASLPNTVEAVTISKVCSSGLKAVVFAAQNIQLGIAESQIARGMENVSRARYYTPRASGQPAFGNVQMKDGLIRDGLWDVYTQFEIGICVEVTAKKKYEIMREQQDEYAIRSYKRAVDAWNAGAFADEIGPVVVSGKKGDMIIDTDGGFLDFKPEKIPNLKPVFIRDGIGTVAAAHSSTLNDGASALILVNKALTQEYGPGPRVLARICRPADAGGDPVDFLIAPANAVLTALNREGIKRRILLIPGLENANVNPIGGTISLGRALGSSGSQILTTLLHQLKAADYGAAAIYNGGGTATAVVVQRIESV